VNPIVIISCGAKKLTYQAKAKDIYIGPYFKMALGFALATTKLDRIFILSAKYGLIRATDVIEPYEMRITSIEAVKLSTVRRQAIELGIASEPNVLVVAGKDYNFIVKSVFPDSKNVVAGAKGMGYQMQLLKQLTIKARAAK
jgi:cytoplasmic iron level regulating protein YaaA (DUF328/UPF0246 family)